MAQGDGLMARGKQANASVMRRYVTAEEDLKAYKRENRAQLNRIHVLEREVSKTRGLEERCDILRMELELATGPEIRRLNELVNEQREKIRSHEERAKHTAKLLARCYDLIVPRIGSRSYTDRLERIATALGPEFIDGLFFPEDVTPERQVAVIRGDSVVNANKLGRERTRTLMKVRGEI